MTSKLALIIEDDFDASFIFSKALEANGFQTEVIPDGAAALERLHDIIPDMVLLDLHLPTVNGRDILQFIRDEPRLKDLLVVLVSADVRMAGMLHDQADFILRKPTNFTQMRDFTARLEAQRSKNEPT